MRRGNEGREFRNELEQQEADVGRAVAPAMTELIQDPAVGKARQPVHGDRRSRDVAAQALQPLAVAGGHGDVGMEARAGDVRATTFLAARAVDPMEAFRASEFANFRG